MFSPRTPPFFFYRDLPDGIGSNIRRARLSARLTRGIAARRAGIAYGTLARIERGAQRPSPATLLEIARTWKVDLDDLAPAWDDVQSEIDRSGLASPGPAIRLMRSRLAVTLKTAAAAAGISVSTLARFERGMHAPRHITVMGDEERGVVGDYDLVVISDSLAQVLGYPTARALTAACREMDVEDEQEDEAPR